MRISLCLCAAFVAGCTTSPNASVLSPSQSNVLAAARTGGTPLLYIANLTNSDVFLFGKGQFRGELVGQLDLSKPHGECVKRSSELIATQSNGKVSIFAYDTTEIREILRDPGQPMGCAVNPVNGDLAVSNYAHASVAIYRTQGDDYQKTPRIFAGAALRHFDFCGYDPSGNLYVDGIDRNGRVAFAKLTSTNRWETVALNRTIVEPCGVQWDGHYMAIGDAGVAPSVILQFSIAGHTGTKMGATVLNRSISVKQFFIDRNEVIGPDEKGSAVGLWAYPQGGPPKAFWYGNYIDQPVGAAIVR
jgi:hypothetical protein